MQSDLDEDASCENNLYDIEPDSDLPNSPGSSRTFGLFNIV